MKDFETQMDKWWKECKARASIYPTDILDKISVNQETELDIPELYNPLPEEGMAIQILRQIDMPKF